MLLRTNSKNWKRPKMLNEGGNVFRDSDKKPLTQRINLPDIDPTIKWLEPIVGLDLIDNKLGTTGKKPSSGDLDLSVDESAYTKEEIYNKLAAWAKQHHPEDKLKSWVAKSGISVHFKTPINGDENQGFVQTDLMFGDPEYMAWSSMGEPGNAYRGQHRMILLNSIASAKGYKWQGFTGLTHRKTGERLTNPRAITDILLGPGHSPDELTSIPKIMNAIKDSENYEELTAMAADTFPKFGVQLPSREVPQSLEEAKKSDPRIQHAEDVIFWEGSSGALRVIDLLNSLASSEGKQATTIKWDGSPAIIFGRDESGDFILTDKSGFFAKGYDGKAKSPEELRDMFVNTRKLDKGKEVSPSYESFADDMSSIFKYYEAAVPPDHRGFFFGDLLYYTTPEIVDGKYQFKPNIVTYRVEPESEFGQRIGQSKTGVAVHREIDFDGNKLPLKSRDIFRNKEVYVLPPVSTQDLSVQINDKELDDLTSYVNSHSSIIDKFLNQDKLRSIKLSNFSSILYTYLNSKVDTGLENLGSDFLDWVEADPRISASKKSNIKQYVQTNSDAYESLWQVVSRTMSVKDDIIAQLEAQDAPVQAYIGDIEGGEGYVTASPGGDVKLVDRSAFTRANRSIQRESLDSLTVFWGSDGFSVTKTLAEWALNLPHTKISNKALYNQISNGVPVTSLIRNPKVVKKALAEAVNWALLVRDERTRKDPIELISVVDINMSEGLASWGVKKATAVLTKHVAKQIPKLAGMLTMEEDSQENNMEQGETIAAVAGGFKPPHRGHLEMIQYYADMSDRVKLFISETSRAIKGDESGRSITADQSIAIWDKYLKDAGLSDKVDVQIISGSPLTATYSVLENASPGQTVLMGCGAKDTYYSPDKLARYTPEGVTAEGAPCPTILDPSTGRPYSATAVRDTIKNNDIEAFKMFLPPSSIGDADEIFSLLQGPIQEMASMAGGASSGGAGAGFAGRAPDISGSEKKKKRHPKNFIAEEDGMVNEVIDYLLGISVG